MSERPIDPDGTAMVLRAITQNWVLAASGTDITVEAESLQADVIGLDAEPIKPFLDVAYVAPRILRPHLSSEDCVVLAMFLTANIEAHAARVAEFERGPHAEWAYEEDAREAERIRIRFWMAAAEWLKAAALTGGADVTTSLAKPAITDDVVHLRWVRDPEDEVDDA